MKQLRFQRLAPALITTIAVVVAGALVAAVWPTGSVHIAITDSDALTEPAGETGRTIPVALQNRTWSRIRLVGTNAC